MIDKEEMFAPGGPHKNIHCKDCVYNRNNERRGDCDMFEFMKPDKIYFEGAECPLHLKK